MCVHLEIFWSPGAWHEEDIDAAVRFDVFPVGDAAVANEAKADETTVCPRHVAADRGRAASGTPN